MPRSSSPTQDGLLNSAVSIPLLRRVIELEEQGVAVPSYASIQASARVVAVRRLVHSSDSCEVSFRFMDGERRETIHYPTS